jgi:hypothetical protein
MRFAKATLIQAVIFMLFGLFVVAAGRADSAPPMMGYLGKGKTRLAFAAPVQKADEPKTAVHTRTPLRLLRPHVPHPHLPHIHVPHF